MTPSAILILDTGGTFGQRYPERPGDSEFEFPIAHEDRSISHVIRRARLNQRSVKIDQLPILKDGHDLDGIDRYVILRICATAGERQIIVIHGTNTMLKTTRQFFDEDGYITDEFSERTIVFTDSRTPECDRDSDAPFNIGFAVAAVQLAGPGVYVAMGGELIQAQECIRTADGLFQRRDSELVISGPGYKSTAW